MNTKCKNCGCETNGKSKWKFKINNKNHISNVKIHKETNLWDLRPIIKNFGAKNHEAIINGEEICPKCNSEEIYEVSDKN